MKTSYAPTGARIKVVGLGGAGCNAITRMVRERIHGVEFIAMNTDAQHLAITEAATRIQLGERTTRGLGAGGDPAQGRKAAAESRDEIRQVLAGSDITFIVAGMGGGTGTGSAPIVAEISRQSGALTIAIVTKPFGFEGNNRMKTAEDGIMELISKVDTLVIIPNDSVLALCNQKTDVDGAFKLADELLYNGVQAIAEVVTVPGLINLDFADIRTIMKDAGPAWMSIGRGFGQNRAADAAKQALASPLLDVSLEGARGVVFNIAGSSNLTLFEVNTAAEILRQAVHPQANVIFGVVLDPRMTNEVRLTLIATGFMTGEAFVGSAREKEITRLLKGLKTEEEFEVPSFLRARHKLPAGLPQRKGSSTAEAILQAAHSVFSSRLTDEKRAARIKKLRDQILRTNPDYVDAVDLLNSLWRLSLDITHVPEFSRSMLRFLQAWPSARQTGFLYNYYSFISIACDIKSAEDLGRTPVRYLETIVEAPDSTLVEMKIPVQIRRLFDVTKLLAQKGRLQSHGDRLKKCREILQDLTGHPDSERRNAHSVCLDYVLHHWLDLLDGAIRISLGNVRCILAINRPLYLNRVNKVQIAVIGGPPGQSFTIAAPDTPDYEVQLEQTSVRFGDSRAIVELLVKPRIQGQVNLLIEIEGMVLQIPALVMAENPFVVGIPVETDDMFVGREEIVSRVIRGIAGRHPTNFLIVGRRRIGKTSLLYAIKRKLPSGILPVFISTERCGKSPTEVCRAMANAISSAVSKATSDKLHRPSRPSIGQDEPVEDFVSWLQSIGDRLPEYSMYAMALLVDEAINLVEWDQRVQGLLRSVLSDMSWIRAVLAGPPDIVERISEGASSPLYNIFSTVKLESLGLEDARKLLVEPLQKCGISNVEPMLPQIYDYSGGIPYYVQAIGHEIIENYFSGSLTGEDLVTQSLAQVRERLRMSYPVTLKRLTAQEKIAIVSVANGTAPSIVAAERLETADLVQKTGDTWVIRAGIEREWVTDYADRLLDAAGDELWSSQFGKIDLSKLANDLRILRSHFTTRKDVTDALTSAILAADKGNGGRTLKHLAKVGNWVLDTATKIGADVAAAAIKHTYGLS